MTHTSGEWVIRKAKSGNDYAIVAGGYLIVAEVFEQIGEDTVIDPKANARLISAAPEMLEALKAVEYPFSEGMHDKQRCYLCHMLKGTGHKRGCKVGDAIAKAEAQP